MSVRHHQYLRDIETEESSDQNPSSKKISLIGGEVNVRGTAITNTGKGGLNVQPGRRGESFDV